MSELKVDTINEQTLGAGVTVDGVLIQDATVSIGGNKVLDERQAAIADTATDTVDATYGNEERDVIIDLRVKLDLVLAAMRAHGLIDT